MLKDELGRPDGLTDKDVFILDPCCGTGGYLVEVLRVIDATLNRNGGGEGLDFPTKNGRAVKSFRNI